MIGLLVRAIRKWRLSSGIEDQRAFYEGKWSPDDIRGWQLDTFNRRWQDIRCNVPYYARLAEKQGLPEQFASWDQFRGRMPILDRETVQRYGSDLTSTEKAPDYERTTGGATGEPIQIPAWSSEQAREKKNFWYARDWFDVTPADRLFLLWGHSHIFGEGVRGWWNQTKRQFKDWLLGYRRVSAYDLSENALRRAGEELLRTRPDYIVGYSEALDRFARVNEDRSDGFRELNLKVAIATAESFPHADSADQIETVLGTPVTMEYGTAETGPIAYQDDSGDFQVFWRHFKLEGRPTDVLENSYELLVTALYPRCFPLIRYRVGDIVVDDPREDDFDQTLSSIVGRSNDYVNLPNDRRIHSIVFKHVMEDLEAVRAYQVVQEASSEIRLYCVLDGDPPSGDVKQQIRRRLGELDPELEEASIEPVPSLEKTPAGKTKRVVRE